MPSDDLDDVDNWDDQPRPGDDEEAEALTRDIVGIMAGKTMLPGALMWWRTRRERGAGTEEPKPPHWWQL